MEEIKEQFKNALNNAKQHIKHILDKTEKGLVRTANINCDKMYIYLANGEFETATIEPIRALVEDDGGYILVVYGNIDISDMTDTELVTFAKEEVESGSFCNVTYLDDDYALQYETCLDIIYSIEQYI